MSGFDRSVKDYLEYLSGWIGKLEDFQFDLGILDPEEVAVMVVDLTKGFCDQGPLASPTVRGVVQAIIDLLEKVHTAGVRNYFLVNDEHEVDAIEFQSFPPHCVRDSREAEPVDELLELDFYSEFQKITKNSIASDLNTVLPGILRLNPRLKHFLIIGDCTDLCVYQLAMYLRLDAYSSQNSDRTVIVPENCVQTYDLDVAAASKIGAQPHPGDLFHAMALHHMFLNGVKIVSKIRF